MAACFGVTAPVTAQDGDVVKQVLAAWQKRRQAIKSIRYTVEGTAIYPKGSLTENSSQAHPKMHKNYPPEDLSYPKKVEYFIEFASGGIRRKENSHILMIPLGEFRPRMEVRLFDGKTAQVYTPREENTSAIYTPSDRQPDLSIFDRSIPDYVLNHNDYPVLFAHGYPTLYHKSIDAVGYFDRTVDASYLRLHQRGTISDRPCVVLRSIPEPGRLSLFDEFWIDLERDAAILRWQAYKRGKAYIRYDIHYSQVEGHWLPQSWQLDQFPLSARGLHEFSYGEKLKVTDGQLHPTMMAFSAPKSHGMVVTDTRGGIFVVASDNRTLVPYGHPTNVWEWWHWLVVTILVSTLLVGLSYWLKRRIQLNR